VTYGRAFSVQPFNNFVVSLDLTGQGVYDLLEQQFSGLNAGTGSKLLQVSEGFTYSYSASAPAGSKIVPGSVRLGGTPVDLAATYRVATNNSLADGGDGFPAFTTGTNRYIGGLDIDAFAAYLTASSPYVPVTQDRITEVP
jgi:5'-nucleotidase